MFFSFASLLLNLSVPETSEPSNLRSFEHSIVTTWSDMEMVKSLGTYGRWFVIYIALINHRVLENCADYTWRVHEDAIDQLLWSIGRSRWPDWSMRHHSIGANEPYDDKIWDGSLYQRARWRWKVKSRRCLSYIQVACQSDPNPELRLSGTTPSRVDRVEMAQTGYFRCT